MPDVTLTGWRKMSDSMSQPVICFDGCCKRTTAIGKRLLRWKTGESKKSLLNEEEIQTVCKEIGKPYFDQLDADLAAAYTWEKLTEMPHFEQVAKRFTESEKAFPHFITKFHYVFFLLHLPGMENQ